jgi:hypothetical protein
MSSINGVGDRVNLPVARSTLFGGAKIESNGASFGQFRAVSCFCLRNYPISGIERDLQIFRAS